jgi:glycerol-3-phosphate acyltransferase PlsY
VPGPLAGIALVIASFLIGAIPWGYVAGKASRGIDLRTVGSGGTGATNVLRTLGARASALVAVLDILKGVVPVAFARAVGFDGAWVAAAAVAAVAGHCWSPFIGFKGGKGVATGAGAAIALFPQVLLIVPVMALVVWTTKYVSLGSLTAAGLATLLAVAYAAAGILEWVSAVAILGISGIIAIRHEGNIRRLLNGNERRIGQKTSIES